METTISRENSARVLPYFLRYTIERKKAPMVQIITMWCAELELPNILQSSTFWSSDQLPTKNGNPKQTIIMVGTPTFSHMDSTSKIVWFWMDCAIGGFFVVTALSSAVKGASLVDAFYLPGFFAYAVWPPSILVFCGYLAYRMRKSYRDAPFMALFAAGFYDLASSDLRLDPNPYWSTYIVWALMLALPVLFLRLRFRGFPYFACYLGLILVANLASPIDLRIPFEIGACVLVDRIAVPSGTQPEIGP